MPIRELDGGSFYVRSAPTVRIEDDLFHIAFSIGNISFDLVMSPETFAATRLVGAEASAKWQVGTLPKDNVRPFRKR